MDNDYIKSQIMQNNRLLIKGVVILFTFHLSLLTSYAQIIKDGSRWWDGERLYTAYVDEAGDVTMEGDEHLIISRRYASEFRRLLRGEG